MAKIINKEIYENEFLKAPIALIDFYADWCGPCKMMAPVIDELANEMDGKVLIGKVNIDNNPDIAKMYQIITIPTFLILKNGQVDKKFVGAIEKEDLIEALK
ncbi:MAG: thioredoxin [Eubacteriales bacterium]|nr:thioredoxin [Eubacteriales bacterium]